MEQHFKDLGESDFRLYKAMQEWHNRIGKPGWTSLINPRYAGAFRFGKTHSWKIPMAVGSQRFNVRESICSASRMRRTRSGLRP
jgi:hypothetical protein